MSREVSAYCLSSSAPNALQRNQSRQTSSRGLESRATTDVSSDYNFDYEDDDENAFEEEDSDPQHEQVERTNFLESNRPPSSVGDERLAKSQSLTVLKKKVASEDKLLATISLPPHHLRKQRSQQSKSMPALLPLGHRRTVAEELEHLTELR